MKQQGDSESQFYKAIMYSAVDPIIITNHCGQIKDLNQATLDTFQYARDELIGQNISILMDHQDAKNHDTHIHRYLKTQKANIIGKGRESIARRKNGDLLTCHLSISDTTINGDVYFVGIIRNIQEEKNYQKKLETQLAFLKHLNEWALTDEQAIDKKIQLFLDFMVYFSCADYVTYTPNNTSERQQKKVYANTDCSQEVLEKLNASTIGTTPYESEINDQEYLKFSFPDLGIQHLKTLPVFSSKQWLGVIKLHYLSSHTNTLPMDPELLRTGINKFGVIIELHTTLVDLEVANDRFERSQNCAHIGTWDWNIQTGDLYWTELIGPLFGYPKGELKTSYENFINSVHPDDRAKVQNAVNRCIKDREPYDIDHRVLWPDGRVRWVNEKGNVTRDKEGNAIKMLGVVQDIQRMKEAEENLIIARLEAEKASRAKSEFLSHMSHELRTPLNSVLGFTQLLENEKLTDSQALFCEQILSGGKILLELVNDILDLARVETNQVHIDIKDIEIEPLVKQCCQLLNQLASKHDVIIERQSSEADHVVRADFLRLKQIMINLLSNAIKYNKPGGSVMISYEVVNGHQLRIKVKDSGIGIPQEQRHEVFQPFSRLGHQNSAIEGVGIGLLLTKKLAISMNGHIDFDSREGTGSTFWVDLPLGKPIEDQPPTSKYLEILPTSQKSILYIEDNEPNIALVKSILTANNTHRFLEATTGEHGIKLAKQHKPDLILLDIHLPDIDGIEVSRRLKNDQATTDIPVIALTADVAQSAQTLTETGCFSEIIYKPFDLQDLMLSISNLTD